MRPGIHFCINMCVLLCPLRTLTGSWIVVTLQMCLRCWSSLTDLCSSCAETNVRWFIRFIPFNFLSDCLTVTAADHWMWCWTGEKAFQLSLMWCHKYEVGISETTFKICLFYSDLNTEQGVYYGIINWKNTTFIWDRPWFLISPVIFNHIVVLSLPVLQSALIVNCFWCKLSPLPVFTCCLEKIQSSEAFRLTSQKICPYSSLVVFLVSGRVLCRYLPLLFSKLSDE